MNSKSSAQVLVKHRFDRPASAVFDAWLDPEAIGAWMFSPALLDQEVLGVSVDRRVGGSFSFIVRRDGKDIDHIGTYLELDRPRRLAFTWGIRSDNPDMSRVSIEFLPIPSGCECSLTHELHPKWEDHGERVAQAWTKMLGALDDLLSKGV